MVPNRSVTTRRSLAVEAIVAIDAGLAPSLRNPGFLTRVRLAAPPVRPAYADLRGSAMFSLRAWLMGPFDHPHAATVRELRVVAAGETRR